MDARISPKIGTFAAGMLVVWVTGLGLPAKEAWAAGACELSLPASAQAYPCGVLASGAASSAMAAEIGKRAGASVRFEYKAVNGVALNVPNARAFEALRATSLKLYPDRPVRMIAKPEGKGPSKSGGGTATAEVTPEGVARIGGPRAGVTIGVAIVDTGIDLNHQDLSVGAERFDGFSTTNSGDDLNGHGTHVAGIVAAKSNGVDVVGVVPDATVYAVRVLDASGSGSDAVVIAGLDWVLGQPAGKIGVVNMSLGRSVTSTDTPEHPMRKAVVALTAASIPVVVAAGNDATKQIQDMVPAGYPEVLAVASTTAKTGNNACSRLKAPVAGDTASYFTTDGAGVAISAPGAAQENVNKACMLSSVGILSLQPGGGTTRMSGTSMAAPHVAGVAAVLKGKGYGPAGIRDYFKNPDKVDGQGAAPYDSPTSKYSFDGTREGILRMPVTQ